MTHNPAKPSSPTPKLGSAPGRSQKTPSCQSNLLSPPIRYPRPYPPLFLSSKERDSEGEWWELFDEKNQLPYYYNIESSKTEWSKPSSGTVIRLSSLQVRPPPPPPPPPPPLALFSVPFPSYIFSPCLIHKEGGYHQGSHGNPENRAGRGCVSPSCGQIPSR